MRALALFFLFLLCGCTTFYKPQGPKEENLLKVASKDVSPASFKKDPEKFKDQVIVWTGIIKKFDVNTRDKDKKILGMNFMIEERPFSWICTTRSGLPAGYLVSSTGSGDFNAKLAVQGGPGAPPTEQMEKEAKDEFREGYFIVLYGHPQVEADKSLSFKATYARTLEPSIWFTEKSNF